MEKLEQMINIYHTAFIIFLILTILFLLLSIFLFFKLNIRDIYDMRTGRGARRKIQEMEEINERTGKLRSDVVYVKRYDTDKNILPQSKSEPLAQMQHTVIYQCDGNKITTDLHREVKNENEDGEAITFPHEGSEATTLLNEGDESTTLLKSDTNDSFKNDNEDSQISEDEDSEKTKEAFAEDNRVTVELYGETTLLSSEEETTLLNEEPKKELPGTFKIEKNVMWVHTDEVL